MLRIYFLRLAVGLSGLPVSSTQRFSLSLNTFRSIWLAMCIRSCAFLADYNPFSASTSMMQFNRLCKLHGVLWQARTKEWALRRGEWSLECTPWWSYLVIVRCSLPTSDYLHESGKTAHLQHQTGMDLSMILVWCA